LLAYRTARGLPRCSPDTGAYCKARARLPEELLQELTRSTGRQLHEQAAAAWLCNGRRVKVVDGTGISMPDTEKNQKAYPKSKKAPPGVGFPILRLVVVFSLAVGTVLEAALGPFYGKGSGELSLFRRLLAELQLNDILLADRLYATYWNVAYAVMGGFDVVLRHRAGRQVVWSRGRGRCSNDGWVSWRKPPRPDWMGVQEYARIPESLHLRAVRFDVRQRGFRTRRVVLITTLTDTDAFSSADLADLYRRRWQAELYLRSIKQSLQMDVLRGRSPDTVRKELWMHLLVYNLVRQVMAQAARVEAVRPDEISFTGALQSMNAFLPEMRAARTAEQAEVLWEVLLWAVGCHRVGDRPDRYEPRKVKRRKKKFPHLRVPRTEARRRLRQRPKRAGKKR
jgi:hypothetical protein